MLRIHFTPRRNPTFPASTPYAIPLGQDHEHDLPTGHVLFTDKVAVAGDKSFEPSLLGRSQQLAVAEPRPSHLRDCPNAVAGKLVANADGDAFIQQQAHEPLQKR